MLFAGCKTTDPIVGVEGQYSCEGANPFWKLDITKEEISFLLLDQEKEIFPYEMPVETDNRKLIVTSRETAEGKVWLKISIEESACYTSTVGKKFPYKVEVDRDGKVYYGCGE
ncbi:MAG: hypothetical protein DWQ02_08515 [Bacteroidetes bacterium]|nr:MAG: hypothetical protein DWQ02_08515 [Bacteroidota bacterium]